MTFPKDTKAEPALDPAHAFGLRGLVAPGEQEEDALETRLRPTSLAEYVGQHAVKQSLEIAIAAARRRGDALDHVLLHGPPGLGKTSLARIIATEMGAGFVATSGPVLEKAGDLAAILSSLQQGDVLFVDEIHRLNRVVEEILYPAMEDFEIDIIVGEGPAARSVKLHLQPFTLVSATTRAGLLTAPLRNRFGLVERLEYYDDDDLRRIVTRSAKLLGAPIDEAGAHELARRSRGTPRIANRLLRRARDFAQERGNGLISKDASEGALALLEIDHMGLDRMDRLLLQTVVERFGGGPVGVETIAAALSEDKGTIEDVYEPYLLQMGFLKRTPRGREVTAHALEHLQMSGAAPSGRSQSTLFDE